MEDEWKGVFGAVNKAREDSLREQNAKLRKLLERVRGNLKLGLYEGVRTLDDRVE